MLRVKGEHYRCGFVKRFRGGLVFQAHRLLYHPTLGLRVIEKKRSYDEDVEQRLGSADRVEEARGVRRRVPLDHHQLHWEPRGKSMVSLVNSHAHATRIGWHLWEINLIFALGLPPGCLGYNEDVEERLGPAERVEEARDIRRRVPLHHHQLHWEETLGQMAPPKSGHPLIMPPESGGIPRRDHFWEVPFALRLSSGWPLGQLVHGEHRVRRVLAGGSF